MPGKTDCGGSVVFRVFRRRPHAVEKRRDEAGPARTACGRKPEGGQVAASGGGRRPRRHQLRPRRLGRRQVRGQRRRCRRPSTAPPQSAAAGRDPHAPPPATPRINGARVFGVRPGHPFLFTIPATGRRPMEFAVDNLPAGLKVDPQTGQITGSLPDRGEYLVTFRAKNALGQAERQFKIVCGDTLALTPHMGWNSWYIWTGPRDRQDHPRRRRRDGFHRHDRSRLHVREHRRLLDGQAGLDRPDAERPGARRPGQHQSQQAFSRHEGAGRLHPRQGAEGGHLHGAGRS